MEYSITKLSQDKAIQLLNDYDAYFNPTLSSHIDIEKYGAKLGCHAKFVLAEDAGSICGYIAFYHNMENEYLYITSYCVSPSFRGQGVSTLLLKKLCCEYRNHCKYVDLEVRKDNAPAIRFYSKSGFKKVEEKEKTLILRLNI